MDLIAFLLPAEGAFTLFLVFLSSVLASGAGVGGGAIIIPILILIGGDKDAAVPLAKAISFGIAVSMFVINFRRSIPIFESRPSLGFKPIISYTVALLMEPMTLAGAAVGVRVNKWLPFEMKAILLVVIGTVIVYKMLMKSVRLHRIEKHSRKQDLSSTLNVLVDSNADSSKVPQLSDELVSLLNKESEMFPLRYILPLFALWCLSLLEAWFDRNRFLSCGSLAYWTLLLACIPVNALFTWWSARKTLRFQETRNRLIPQTSDSINNSVCWSSNLITLTSIVSFVAGIFSSAIGIGGSTLKGPFLQILIENPQVASATTAFMLISTSSSSLIEFYFLNSVNVYSSLYWVLIGMLAAVVGHNIMKRFIEASGRRSLVVYALALYVAIGCILMTYISISNAINNTQSVMQFHNICVA